QECDDLRAPFDELATVSPIAVSGVGERDTSRIAAVPGVLSRPNLLYCALQGEGRWRWTVFAHDFPPNSASALSRIRSNCGRLRLAVCLVLCDDPAHHRPIAPAFAVGKESAGNRHLPIYRHFLG